uniref:Uncharacterized protein n=1 Tax=Arundo donax TaxID=35708 RepID=A0A0A9F3W3_ARUDO
MHFFFWEIDPLPDLSTFESNLSKREQGLGVQLHPCPTLSPPLQSDPNLLAGIGTSAHPV